MFGVSETIRKNATPFAKQPGAHTARAIEIVTGMTAAERDLLEHRGVLPVEVEEQAVKDGFDVFVLANEARVFSASRD